MTIKNILHFIEKNKNTKTLLCIYGATASGKTALSLEIAKKLNGEIISADSRILYKDAKIGVAAPSEEELKAVKHYFVGEINSEKTYTVKEFQDQAWKIIKDILKRKKLPIIIGGTNLYMDAVIEGYNMETYTLSHKDKQKLEKMSDEEKFNLLQKLDPEACTNISINNPRHYHRKLEYILATCKKFSEKERKQTHSLFTPLKIGIEKERNLLYQRIEKRIDLQIQEGIIEETNNLLKKYPKTHPLMSGLGYRQVRLYLNGLVNKEEMIHILKRDTRRFAKRQLSWMREKNDIQFF